MYLYIYMYAVNYRCKYTHTFLFVASVYVGVAEKTYVQDVKLDWKSVQQMYKNKAQWDRRST